jgi:hypothetical protein
MVVRARQIAAALALLTPLAACEPMYGPPPPGRTMVPAPVGSTAFNAGDFAWSKVVGRNILAGTLAPHPGPARYTCSGQTVVLTPETPWARRRMSVLYRSAERAALPTDDVRSRASEAPSGDSEPFVRRALCDQTDHFSFTGLPDGAWFVVTLAKPAGGASGPSLALMRRVITRGGRVTDFEL